MDYIYLTHVPDSTISSEIRASILSSWHTPEDWFSDWRFCANLHRLVGYTVYEEHVVSQDLLRQRIYSLYAWKQFHRDAISVDPQDEKDKDIILKYAERFYIAKVDGYPKIWFTGGFAL